MWQVNVPLAAFYDAIVEAGREAKYLALLTALAREADSASFYEDITRYWDSLHDVTGPDVLFVLAGPEASTKVRYHGVPDGHKPVVYSSQGVAVVTARGRPLRPRLSAWAARTGTSYAPPTAELARSQTLAIGLLRRRLGVSEDRLPCLHLALIGYQYRHDSPTIPLPDHTVYETVKQIVSRFDKEFATVRRMANRLEQLKQSRRASPEWSWPLHDGSGSDCSPPQLRAARAIVAACAAAPSAPAEIAAARAECFRLLRLLKGTRPFRSLQRHIDVYLNYQGALTSLKTEEDIAATASGLEAAWEAVCRRSTEMLSVPVSSEVKHRIFIAYQSTDRWIAEQLHSALTQLTPTFLDVRCLRPGDRWVERIRGAQDNAEVTVVLVGASGATSWFQQAEYLRAIELARANKQRLVPVYTSGAPLPVPYGLEGVQGVMTTWASGLREDDVRRIAREIAALLPNR